MGITLGKGVKVKQMILSVSPNTFLRYMELSIKGGGSRNFIRLEFLVILLDIYYCFMIRKFEKTVNESN